MYSLKNLVSYSSAVGHRNKLLHCPISSLYLNHLKSLNETKLTVHISGDSEDPGYSDLFEPPRGKTNNVVSEQVRHEPTCSLIA